MTENKTVSPSELEIEPVGGIKARQVSSSLGLRAGRGQSALKYKYKYKAMSIFKEKCKTKRFPFGPLLAQKVKVPLF